MRAIEFLTESATDNLYHYTSAYGAYQILSGGQFLLQNGRGSEVEKQYQPEGYDYFLSATRSKIGDYHSRYPMHGGVIFNLDGRIINQTYKTKPVDYWERSWNNPGTGRTSSLKIEYFQELPVSQSKLQLKST